MSGSAVTSAGSSTTVGRTTTIIDESKPDTASIIIKTPTCFVIHYAIQDQMTAIEALRDIARHALDYADELADEMEESIAKTSDEEEEKKETCKTDIEALANDRAHPY